jgi:hypothetical protein
MKNDRELSWGDFTPMEIEPPGIHLHHEILQLLDRHGNLYMGHYDWGNGIKPRFYVYFFGDAGQILYELKREIVAWRVPSGLPDKELYHPAWRADGKVERGV